MYQQPNQPQWTPPQQPPNAYYPPPQQPWQQQQPPQQRASRMPVKIAAIACLVLGFALSLAGSPALGGIFVLPGFVLIFFI